MNILHIKAIECPHCKEEIKSEQVRDKHCNGEWNEHRVFKCGLELHFSPNFMEVREEEPCTRTKEYKKQKEKERECTLELLEVIEKNKSKISLPFKDRLERNIKNIGGIGGI
jgi:hypothetical protein